MADVFMTFDKKSNLWTKDQQFNIHTLLRYERLVNVIIRRKGYVYLNQIYELLGLDWNPEHENICFRKQENRLMFVEFETFNKSDGSILIYIHY